MNSSTQEKQHPIGGGDEPPRFHVPAWPAQAGRPSVASILSASLLALAFAALSVHAAPALRTYRYGEAWWWEPREDADTSLLLHFGPPAERSVERVAREA